MSNIKNIIKWGVIGVVAISLLLFLFGGKNPQQQPPVTKVEENKVTQISKEQFEAYYNIFIDLENLQEEYEQVYAKYGYIAFGEASEIEEEDYPKYGSLTRKITSVRDTIPKIKTSMSQEERDLSLNLSAYGTSLIFLSPGKDSLESLDVATETKATVEGTFNDIKQKYGY